MPSEKLVAHYEVATSPSQKERSANDVLTTTTESIAKAAQVSRGHVILQRRRAEDTVDDAIARTIEIDRGNRQRTVGRLLRR
jgi:hypothetical protein